MKVSVGNFLSIIQVAEFLLKPENQMKLPFGAKDKLGVLTQYVKRIDGIEAEQLRISETFGELIYTITAEKFTVINDGKIYETETAIIKSQIEDNETSKEVRDALIKDSKMVVEMTPTTIRFKNDFFNVTNVDRYEANMSKLMEHEINLAEAEPFTLEDLENIPSLDLASIKSFGSFYEGNKEVTDAEETLTIELDMGDEEEVKKEVEASK